jgi:hypothetical protein
VLQTVQVRLVPGEPGGTVTVIYSALNEAPKKSGRSLLPLLVVLFVVSYSILTMVVVEQGRTIEAQRSLLQEMLKDSTQLAALKGKLAREQSIRTPGKPGAQPKKDADSGNAGSARPTPPAGDTRRPGKSARTTKQVPKRPAADLQDVRRFTRQI